MSNLLDSVYGRCGLSKASGVKKTALLGIELINNLSPFDYLTSPNAAWHD